MNTDNTWLQHLQGGPHKQPTLKAEGRLKKKPKVIHKSPNQRRVFLNG